MCESEGISCSIVMLSSISKTHVEAIHYARICRNEVSYGNFVKHKREIEYLVTKCYVYFSFPFRIVTVESSILNRNVCHITCPNRVPQTEQCTFCVKNCRAKCEINQTVWFLKRSDIVIIWSWNNKTEKIILPSIHINVLVGSLELKVRRKCTARSHVL